MPGHPNALMLNLIHPGKPTDSNPWVLSTAKDPNQPAIPSTCNDFGYQSSKYWEQGDCALAAIGVDNTIEIVI
jgi:hypothetical protein